MSANNCIFCKIIEKTIPANVIQETDDLVVIEDIAPKAPIHYLIIPKKHVTDIQSLSADDHALAGNIIMMAYTIAHSLPKPDFRLVVNSGKDAGQHVFHLHFHFLSGQKMAF